MASLRRILSVAGLVSTASLSTMSLREQEEMDDPAACEMSSLSFKDHLRHAHFYCTGVEKFWNGPMCNCAVKLVRNYTLSFLRKAAVDIPNENFTVNGIVSSTTFEDAGGTRAYLPQCRADDKHRVPALFYRSMKQSGDDIIRKALRKIGNMKEETVASTFWGEHHLCYKLEEKRGLAKGKSDGPVLFTFVRDPMDHFLEVYLEASNTGAFNPTLKDPVAPVGSSRHFMEFLRHVLSAGAFPGYPLLQAQMLQESNCSSRFDFIGKMEFARYDWTALATRIGCEGSQFDFPEGLELRPTNTKLSMIKKFLAEDGEPVQRVLCWLLLPDYAVFDYPIPQVCQEGDFQQIF